MNCSGYERQMSDYLDGQLSKATEDELRFHLNGCPRCRLRIQDMESAMRAVKSLPAVSPRPMFEQQLGNLLNREVARELYASSWLRRVSAAFSELGELSRQRPVQLVFATSLILTITVIGGFAEMAGPAERSDSSSGPAMAFFPADAHRTRTCAARSHFALSPGTGTRAAHGDRTGHKHGTGNKSPHSRCNQSPIYHKPHYRRQTGHPHRQDHGTDDPWDPVRYGGYGHAPRSIAVRRGFRPGPDGRRRSGSTCT